MMVQTRKPQHLVVVVADAALAAAVPLQAIRKINLLPIPTHLRVAVASVEANLPLLRKVALMALLAVEAVSAADVAALAAVAHAAAADVAVDASLTANLPIPGLASEEPTNAKEADGEIGDLIRMSSTTNFKLRPPPPRNRRQLLPRPPPTAKKPPPKLRQRRPKDRKAKRRRKQKLKPRPNQRNRNPWR